MSLVSSPQKTVTGNEFLVKKTSSDSYLKKVHQNVNIFVNAQTGILCCLYSWEPGIIDFKESVGC